MTYNDMEVNSSSVTTTIIRHARGWMPIDFKELWFYRELLYFLTWREIKVRYKQTLLGVGWAIIQPLAMMVIFTLFFGKLAQIPSEGTPYPLFNYTALLPWILFAEGMARSSNSLVQDANLVRKVYFPRLIMPLAGILSPLVDFCIAFGILGGRMFYYSYYPTAQMIWVPVFTMWAMVNALGIGLWLSTLNIKYRDIRYVIPFIIQAGLFVSPVVYSSSLLPRQYEAIYALNPMVGVISGMRWAVLGIEPSGSLVGISIVATAVILISGLFYFRRQEKTFADLV